MQPIFCDCCGDLTKAVYPCKFVFHDGLIVDLNVCLDCMENGTLEINVGRKRLVAKIKRRLIDREVIGGNNHGMGMSKLRKNKL